MRFISFGTCIYIVLLFIACNPVKQVLHNPTQFEKVAQEVVRRGYCINDTTKHDTLTTIITKDSLIHDTLKITSLIAVPSTIDTLFPSGAHLTINQNGLISLACPSKEIIKTATVNHYIRDLKREQLLQQDIDIRDGMINELNLAQHQYTISENKTKEKIKELKSNLRVRTFQLIGLIVLLIILITINLYKKVRSAFFL
jgi:hypothetical protein